MSIPHHRILIAGTGFSGIGAAIQLKRRGIHDFVIIERAKDVGGTWRDNSYPGCACDVPSRLYSFSFASNPDWSRRYSPQGEIWEYLQRVAREHDVLPHVLYGHDFTSATWDDDASRWVVQTSAGTYTADIVISGMGGLSEPSIPDLPGLKDFKGAVFHSATWDHDHQLDGERIAVIGTGASAIQFVPQIRRVAERVDLYQRTPPWLVPRMDRAITPLEKRLFKAFPPLMTAIRGWIYAANELLVFGLVHNKKLLKLPERVARLHLARQVRDPELRKKITPSYRIGCKRILRSDDYYPALCQENVDVITEGVAEIREHSIIDSQGVEREVDTIILGTGFKVTDMPLVHKVTGRGGRRLDEDWSQTISTHHGTMVNGYPNFFVLLGPNTGLGHTSIVYMIESQLNLVMDAIATLEQRGAKTIEPTLAAQQAFCAEIDRRSAKSVWTTGGCASWYLDKQGRNATLWPDFTFNYRRKTRHIVESEYEFDVVTPATREPQPVAV